MKSFLGGGFFRKGWYSSLENATQTARKVFLFSRKISFVEKGHDLKKIRYRVLPTQNNEVFIN